MYEIIEKPSYIFKSPTCIIIAGPSGSGKTTLLHEILKNNDVLFEQKIIAIVYCYSLDQDVYKTMEETIEPDIIFYKGVPDENQIEQWKEKFTPNHWILVMDDLIRETKGREDIECIYTKGSHHWNFTLITLTQNIYYYGKTARTSSLNSHYFILTRNVRDVSQIRALGSQVVPGRVKSFINIYNDATKQSDRVPYLLLCLHPFTDENLKFMTHILPEEGATIIYRARSK